jgi:hypothetical protein
VGGLVRTGGAAGLADNVGGAAGAAAGGLGAAGGAVTRCGVPAAGVAGAGGRTAGAAGFASCTAGVAGRAGGAAGAAGCCLARIAFSTSPGLEMWERSIFGLRLSLSGRAVRVDFAPRPSPEVWKCARTFSASCSSRELEWVFFSVTPTSGSTSRMALLLISSSLARSLIRILLIRLFVPPDRPAKSSYQPHGSSLQHF